MSGCSIRSNESWYKKILEGYADDDWAADSNDRKFYSGFIFMLANEGQI